MPSRNGRCGAASLFPVGSLFSLLTIHGMGMQEAFLPSFLSFILSFFLPSFLSFFLSFFLSSFLPSFHLPTSSLLPCLFQIAEMRRQREEDKAAAAAEREKKAAAKRRRKAEQEAIRRKEERQMLALYRLEQEEALANEKLMKNLAKQQRQAERSEMAGEDGLGGLTEAEAARQERMWRRQQEAEQRFAAQGRKKRAQTERAMQPKPRYVVCFACLVVGLAGGREHALYCCCWCCTVK